MVRNINKFTRITDIFTISLFLQKIVIVILLAFTGIAFGDPDSFNYQKFSTVGEELDFAAL